MKRLLLESFLVQCLRARSLGCNGGEPKSIDSKQKHAAIGDRRQDAGSKVPLQHEVRKWHLENGKSARLQAIGYIG
jgi:hypothetical protein